MHAPERERSQCENVPTPSARVDPRDDAFGGLLISLYDFSAEEEAWIDLPFVFGNLDAPCMQAFAGKEPDTQRLADAMMDAWSAFFRSGDPSCAAVGAWPPYDAEGRATLELGARCRVANAPLEEERALWREVWSDT